jgi:signal transduction histidine kinase
MHWSRLSLTSTAVKHICRESKRAVRARAANDLNDHFLQDMQGLILQFQTASDCIPANEPARNMMETALERADTVLAEFRDRAKALSDGG